MCPGRNNAFNVGTGDSGRVVRSVDVEEVEWTGLEEYKEPRIKSN